MHETNMVTIILWEFIIFSSPVVAIEMAILEILHAGITIVQRISSRKNITTVVLTFCHNMYLYITFLLTLNYIRYSDLPSMHNGGGNHFPEGIFQWNLAQIRRLIVTAKLLEWNFAWAILGASKFFPHPKMLIYAN